MNIHSLFIVLWSGIITFVQAACVATLLTGGFVLLLLPLGWTYNDLFWKLGLGVATILQGFTPLACFWPRRSKPVYPPDALGLLLVPIAVPFAVMHFARQEFALCFGRHLTRSGEAILVVGGCAFVLPGLVPAARLFLLWVRWPSFSIRSSLTTRSGR